MKKLKTEVFNYYNKTNTYPSRIKLNTDYLLRLKEAGHVNISAVDPSKRVILGMEIIQDNQVADYEFCS
ncbi:MULTISPECIES: hypothetical protein [Bacillus]|uniref:hypothetical protein n=1 Tax=Bacillus TaxID=1386 RepID=UPI0002E8B7C8|nr:MULTISPECIES: hypothetical protein [Bacillus]